MKPRVCIFAAESLLHWSGFYVRAFRQSCETVVLGPPMVPEDHNFPDWDLVARYVVKNDVHTQARDALDRLALLPDGWDPDLLVVIQSGDVPMQGIGQVGCPTVYISVDTWHASTEYLESCQYDFVFLAQKALVKYMRRRGCCRAFWLPLGCDPEYHYADARSPIAHDIVFVGRVHFYVNKQRRKRLEVLDKDFELGLYSGVGGDEMAEAYGRAPLIFNSSIACDVNMRVFEALATGRTLITNRDADANGLFELFDDGIHLVTYDDSDMVAQVRDCLEHPEKARKIGEAGRREVLNRHTYAHRVQEIFDTLRKHHIEVGQSPRPRIRQAIQLRDHIPFGALRVLDIGLGLKSSRVAMLHRGVEHLAGIAPDEERAQQRAKSYDDVWTLDNGKSPASEYDTVVCVSRGQGERTLDGLLRYCGDWLLEGGRLVLGLSEYEVQSAGGAAESSGLIQWFSDHGYKVLTWSPPTDRVSQHVVVAASMAATMDEVNTAMYAEFPVNGEEPEPWKRLMNGATPDSPGAAGP